MSSKAGIDRKLIEMPELRTPEVIALSKAEMHLKNAKKHTNNSRHLESIQACLSTISITKEEMIADEAVKQAREEPISESSQLPGENGGAGDTPSLLSQEGENGKS